MTAIVTTPRSYRDYLAGRGIEPLAIERTEKAPGDLVLSSWCRPVASVGASMMLHDPKGRFVGKAHHRDGKREEAA